MVISKRKRQNQEYCVSHNLTDIKILEKLTLLTTTSNKSFILTDTRSKDIN